MGEHKRIKDFNPIIRILDRNHIKYLQHFKSGSTYPEKGLGDYIKGDAFHDLLTGDGVSYIVFQTTSSDDTIPDEEKIIDVVAFFTLVSSAIPYIYRTVDEDGVYEAMCEIPAVKVNMFAVNDKYQDTFYENKPISALVFETIIDIIDNKAKTDMGIKAIYLHSLPSAEKFYLRNHMLKAEEYMQTFSENDDDLTAMYVFIRDVKIVYET